MNSIEKERRLYTRTIILSFALVVVCIGVDIYRYIQGTLTFNTEFALSLVLYGILIFLGIRSIRKRRALKEIKE